MTSEDESRPSVRGPAHPGASEEPAGPFQRSTAAAAVLTAGLVGLATLSAVRTGHGTLGLGLLTASVLAVGSAGVAELLDLTA